MRHQKSIKMKKIITLISASCLALVISCGPSAEEKAKLEQQTKDSLNAVMEQHRQDSIALAEHAIQDSLAAVQKAANDSLMAKAAQDSLAAMKTKGNHKVKTPVQKQMDEVKKATRGRG